MVGLYLPAAQSVQILLMCKVESIYLPCKHDLQDVELDVDPLEHTSPCKNSPRPHVATQFLQDVFECVFKSINLPSAHNSHVGEFVDVQVPDKNLPAPHCEPHVFGHAVPVKEFWL